MYFFDFLSNRREYRAKKLRDEARQEGRQEGRQAERQFLRQRLEKEFGGDRGYMERMEKVFNGH